MMEETNDLLREVLKRVGPAGNGEHANVMSSVAATNAMLDGLATRFARHEAQDDVRFGELQKVIYGVGSQNKGLVQQASEAIDSAGAAVIAAKNIADAKIKQDEQRTDHQAIYISAVVGGIVGFLAMLFQIFYKHT